MGFPCPLSLNFKEKKICLVDKNLSDMHIRNIKLQFNVEIPDEFLMSSILNTFNDFLYLIRSLTTR